MCVCCLLSDCSQCVSCLNICTRTAIWSSVGFWELELNLLEGNSKCELIIDIQDELGVYNYLEAQNKSLT